MTILDNLRIIASEASDKWPDYVRENSIRSVAREALEVITSLSQALSSSNVALNDWLHIYAPDECPEAMVQESKDRIGKVGTIGYIAEVTAENRAALLAAKTHLEG